MCYLGFMIFANEVIGNFTTNMLPRDSLIRVHPQPDNFDKVFKNFNCDSVKGIKDSIEFLKNKYSNTEAFDSWMNCKILDSFSAASYVNPGFACLKELRYKEAQENMIKYIKGEFSKVKGSNLLSEKESQLIFKFVNNYFTKAKSPLLFGHFALGLSFYIHFTSPIRRYFFLANYI